MIIIFEVAVGERVKYGEHPVREPWNSSEQFECGIRNVRDVDLGSGFRGQYQAGRYSTELYL